MTVYPLTLPCLSNSSWPRTKCVSLPHLPYSLDLAICDFLFSDMKLKLIGKIFIYLFIYLFIYWRFREICSRCLMVLWKKSFIHASNDGRIIGLSVVTPKGSTLKVTWHKIWSLKSLFINSLITFGYNLMISVMYWFFSPIHILKLGWWWPERQEQQERNWWSVPKIYHEVCKEQGWCQLGRSEREYFSIGWASKKICRNMISISFWMLQ